MNSNDYARIKLKKSSYMYYYARPSIIYAIITSLESSTIKGPKCTEPNAEA